MSWTFDESGALINLDKIEKLDVLEVEEPEKNGPHYCLIAYFAPGESQLSTWLTSGTEEQCLKSLHLIASKLHLVKV